MTGLTLPVNPVFWVGGRRAAFNLHKGEVWVLVDAWTMARHCWTEWRLVHKLGNWMTGGAGGGYGKALEAAALPCR
jgi:hypothetical protein